MAQEKFNSLSDKRAGEECITCVRMGFMYLNRAISWASRNYEASCFDGAFAQGGSYEQVRLDAAAFFEMAQRCHTLFRDASNDEIKEQCSFWLLKAKNFIDSTREQEASATNIQYAFIPEEQDYSIITKNGKPLRR